MKKLLAIVLCIAMIASISVTAFARTGGLAPDVDESETKTIEKPDLWPVVKQANHFYGSLIKYDGMNKVVNLYNGFTGAFPKLFENNEGMNREFSVSFGMIFNAFAEAQFDPNTGKLIPPALKIPFKVEGMDEPLFFALPLTTDFLNTLINAAWSMLGYAYAGQYNGNLGNANDGTIAGAIANAENNIPTVSAPTGWDSSSSDTSEGALDNFTLG